MPETEAVIKPDRSSEDEYFLRLAIELAYQARAMGEDPFGAVLTYHGALMHQSTDQSIRLSDPFDLFTLYSSTEPCMMCSGAIHWARISRVVFSVSQEMLQQISGGRLKPKCADLLNVGHQKIEVIGPLLPNEGLAVYQGFAFESKKERHGQYCKRK